MTGSLDRTPSRGLRLALVERVAVPEEADRTTTEERKDRNFDRVVTTTSTLGLA
jgi:hypothetical protein